MHGLKVTREHAVEFVSLRLYLTLLLLLSGFSRVRLCATPKTAAHQVPLSLGFSRQEHWSRLLFPSPTRYATDVKRKDRLWIVRTHGSVSLQICGVTEVYAPSWGTCGPR